MGTPKLGVVALLAAGLFAAVGGCAEPGPEAIPTAPAAVAQAAAALVGATARPATPEPTAAPAEAAVAKSLPAAAPAEVAPQPAPDEPRALLDLDPGEPLALLAEIPIARTDFGVRAAFSPDGRVLLHNDNGMVIQQFNLAGNEPLPDLLGIEEFSPFTISVSSDGSTVVGDDLSHLRVWSVGSGEQIGLLELPPVSGVTTAGYHADDFFFAADVHGNVLVWDPNSWEEISGFSYPTWVSAAALFPDGSAIALQDAVRNEIGIFDLSGVRLGTVPVGRADDRLLSISPDGSRFLLHVDFGYPSEGIRIVEVATGRALLDLPMLNFRQFAVSSDWSLLAAVGVQNELRLYRLPEGELALAQPLGVARTLGLSMSSDASLLALYVFKAGNGGPAIQVWGPAPAGR